MKRTRTMNIDGSLSFFEQLEIAEWKTETNPKSKLEPKQAFGMGVMNHAPTIFHLLDRERA